MENGKQEQLEESGSLSGVTNQLDSAVAGRYNLDTGNVQREAWDRVSGVDGYQKWGGRTGSGYPGGALQREVPHPNAVRLSLQRRREQRDQPPPLAITLPDKAQVRNLVVRPHALNGKRPSARRAACSGD